MLYHLELIWSYKPDMVPDLTHVENQLATPHAAAGPVVAAAGAGDFFDPEQKPLVEHSWLQIMRYQYALQGCT